MIDYISAIKYQCKDNLFLGHCKAYSSRLNDVGWKTYYLNGCNKMVVQYKPDVGLKIEGSLPYFFRFPRIRLFSNIHVPAVFLL